MMNDTVSGDDPIRTVIRNCPGGRSCEQSWGDLAETGRDGVRTCRTCDKEVHFVSSRLQLAMAVQNGYRICMPHDLLDRPRSVPPPASVAPPMQLAYDAGSGSATVPPGIRDLTEIPAFMRKYMNTVLPPVENRGPGRAANGGKDSRT
jgi:hypothetical protein